MSRKSQRETALSMVRFMDPGWHAAVVPVAGEGGWAICAQREDKYTGRTLYGRVFATYVHRLRAELLADELNAEHMRLQALRCQHLS